MAGRKRKAEASRVLEDEADWQLYGAFRGAANSLSQLYALAGVHQKLSFHAGERHAMEKLYRWILQQNENGLSITVSDIASHIQREIEYGNEDALASPRSQYSIQNRQASMHIPNASNQQASPILFAQANLGSQPKNSVVFSNALSSPVGQSNHTICSQMVAPNTLQMTLFVQEAMRRILQHQMIHPRICIQIAQLMGHIEKFAICFQQPQAWNLQ